MELIAVKSDEQIKLFGTYKLELIKYHQQYANKLGLTDKVVENYTYNDTIKHLNEVNYRHFLVVDNSNIVGILEYRIEQSEIDDNKILYLKNLYIRKDSRGKGLAKAAINELKKTGYRIELECWYGMPANDFYKSLGAKELKTRYAI